MNKKQKNKGSTLVELSVVMAVLAIVASMIVSFSALVAKQVNQNQSRNTFIEESYEIKRELKVWLSGNDTSSSVISVSDAELGATDASVSFDILSGVFATEKSDGQNKEISFKTVKNIEFDMKRLTETAAVLKCTVSGTTGYDDILTETFIFTLRCGSFREEATVSE